jgi:hypothetical protein
MANDRQIGGAIGGKIAGAFGGPLADMAVSYALNNLIKPNNNPYLEQQKSAYNAKRRQMNYYQSMLDKQDARSKKYQPVYDKMTDMAIEGANKPLTSTDIFKGTGAANEILNNNAEQASAAGADMASKAGLYGGQRVGLQNSINNANRSAINKNISDFSSAYELQAPQRMAAAAGMAGDQYNNAQNSLMGLLGGMQQGYNELGSMAGDLGNAYSGQLQARQGDQAALMQMLGGMRADQAQRKMFDAQLKSQEAMSQAQIKAMQQSGGYGNTYNPYLPNAGKTWSWQQPSMGINTGNYYKPQGINLNGTFSNGSNGFKVTP